MLANQNLLQLFLLVTSRFSLYQELRTTLKMQELHINQNDVNGKLILQGGMIVLSPATPRNQRALKGNSEYESN
jgi:hypothetical protein